MACAAKLCRLPTFETDDFDETSILCGQGSGEYSGALRSLPGPGEKEECTPRFKKVLAGHTWLILADLGWLAVLQFLCCCTFCQQLMPAAGGIPTGLFIHVDPDPVLTTLCIVGSSEMFREFLNDWHHPNKLLVCDCYCKKWL